MDWLADLVARFVVGADDTALAQRQILALDAGGETAARGFLEVCRLVGEAATDRTGLVSALDDLGNGDVLARIGALVVGSFAAVRADYPARPDAQAARARIAARAEDILEEAGGAFGADVHQFLQRLAGEAIMQVSAIAANRAPLVRVETGLSLPSSALAWDLYGDPSRGEELVARNRSGTPLLMPTRLEALAN
ncbi:hypothetical protein [Paracoccus sp. (in: a-proteobacteria)]|uniref:hypothetical protein n=1 Tax=Paracoccus sp. TaxID=267 RepID=UPI002AFDDF72|nr:hypothetical protein [Paracoccus sp. (in: a-proteobacteria)]